MQVDPTNFIEVLLFALSSAQGLLVTVSLIAMMVAMGTRLTRGDVVRSVREYNLVARWVLANLLAVPLFAVLLGFVFGLPGPILLGLLLVAVAPGAPFIPLLIRMAGEDSHEAVRLTAALTIVSATTVPLLVAAALAILHVDTGFSPWRFFIPLMIVLVLPLVAGGAVREWRPDLATLAARRLTTLANALLFLVLATVVLLDLGATVRVFAALIGTGALLVMVLFVFASVLIGWLTGGPDARSRRILALGTAGRNVNIALFVATTAFPASEADASIAAFAVVMLLVSLLVAWYWKRNPEGDESTRGDREVVGEA